MKKLGFDNNLGAYNLLLGLYTDKKRHYHNLDHIDDCLNKLGLYCACAEPGAVSASEINAIELALWFHDAVYRPLCHDNEQRSAIMATEFLLANRAQIGLVESVEKLILATASHSSHQDCDIVQIMLDIDLSILGAAPAGFAKYEAGIRQEYHLVPLPIYQKKRRLVLQSFLDMPQIYRSFVFHERFEQQARVNLAAALS